MASQVLGTVSEVEGKVTVMRDGEAIELMANDAIRSDDVITASDTGRANVVLTNSYGEPIGNLLISPNGSVAAHSELIDGQAGFHFETLSADGVALADIDPDYADLIVVEEGVAGSGGMFGLFDAGLIAGGSMGTTAAVGAGAVGIAALGSGGDDGTGPTGSSDGTTMQDNMDTSNPDETGGTTGTPLDAALDPLAAEAEGTPLEPVADALSGGAGSDGSGGGDTGGTTGTPLDMVLDPLAAQAEGTPVEMVTDTLLASGSSSPIGSAPVSADDLGSLPDAVQ